jgi:hypothetical protein
VHSMCATDSIFLVVKNLRTGEIRNVGINRSSS